MYVCVANTVTVIIDQYIFNLCFVTKYLCSHASIVDVSFAFHVFVHNRGFSYVDLVEETLSHKMFALKRLTCHSKEEESIALQEVEVMRTVHHNNLVPLVGHTVVKVGHYTKTVDVVSEVFIVMPFYPVSTYISS